MDTPLLNTYISSNPCLLAVNEYLINPEGKEEYFRTIYIPVSDIRYLEPNWNAKCFDVFLKDKSSIEIKLKEDTDPILRISLNSQE